MIDVVISLRVQYFIWFDGIFQDRCFGDFLGLEALILLQVLSIIVSQMVIGDNWGKSETGTNQEITHHSLESSLSTLEIWTSNEGIIDSSILNYGRVESILWGTIKVSDLLFNGSNTIEYWWGKGLRSSNSLMHLFNGLNLREQELLGIGSPEDDHWICSGFHVLDVFSNCSNLFLVWSNNDIVCSIILICSNKIAWESSLQWDNFLQVWL